MNVHTSVFLGEHLPQNVKIKDSSKWKKASFWNFKRQLDL